MRIGAGRGRAIALWLAIGVAAGAWLAMNLQVKSDLTVFLPAAATPAQAHVLSQLRNGFQNRLLLVGLRGENSAALAQLSKMLAARLQDGGAFTAVHNGTDFNASALSQAALHDNLLFRYRYLLDPNLGPRSFSVAGLRATFAGALDALASPLAMVAKPLVFADPGLSFVHLGEHLAPVSAPSVRNGVWFSSDGRMALLVAETRAPGFDLDAQQAAIAHIRELGAQLSGGRAEVLVAGPAVFGVQSRAEISTEATWLSAIATVLLLIFLAAILRSLRGMLLAAVPLVYGMLLALVAVVAVFGSLQGITLAFGVTILGVAVDYPLHFLLHHHRGEAPVASVRRIWTTLLLGMLTTAVGYVAMLFAGIAGLAQLAVFAIVGLAGAAAATRWLVPALAGAGGWRYPGRVGERLRGVRRWHAPWLIYACAIAALVFMGLSGRTLWQDQLSELVPLSQHQLALDQRLREALNVPDMNRVIVVGGATRQAVLQRLENLRPALEQLRQRGQLGGYRLVSDMLPSTATQRARQAVIPDRATLASRVRLALADLPFKPEAFRAYLQDLAASRDLPPLTAAALAKSPLHTLVDNLLKEENGRWFAIVPLNGVHDETAVQAAVDGAGIPTAEFLNVRDTAVGMLRAYRRQALALFGWGSLGTVLLLLAITRAWRQTLRVLIAPYCAVVVTAGALVAAGISLSLFHIVSLMLVIGLGIDYGLFFNRMPEDAEEDGRTVMAIFTCWLSTLIVFGLLAAATTPVLRAIGLTVAIGCFCDLLFALLLAPAVRFESRAQAVAP